LQAMSYRPLACWCRPAPRARARRGPARPARPCQASPGAWPL